MIKEIKEFCGKYFISDSGIVTNRRSRELKIHINPKTGYCQVFLSKDGRFVSRYVHRLVAEAFIENPNLLREVNHIDGNKQNNSYKNLEWVSRKENVIHAYKSGLRKTTKVIAYTKDGIAVKEFLSVSDAAKFCGVTYTSGISRCLTKKALSAHGYIWKYAI